VGDNPAGAGVGKAAHGREKLSACGADFGNHATGGAAGDRGELARAGTEHGAAAAGSAAVLRSITGVGAVSAVMLLAELAMLPEDRDVRQWVAFAGLDPREFLGKFGAKENPHQQSGNRHLRHALYMPALVASRYEPHLRAFYQRLLSRGKTKRQAVLAVARKLLHAIYGMFRSGQNYDGTRLFASSATA
jgi:transposase